MSSKPGKNGKAKDRRRKYHEALRKSGFYKQNTEKGVRREKALDAKI